MASTAASAVVLHGRPPLDERVVVAAKKSGAAVLLVDPSVPWSQLANVTQTLVNGGTRTGDLFGLADVIAGVVGGPVTIEDQQSRVLAYSYRQQDVDPVRVQTILGRRVPEEARRALDEYGVFSHLASSDEPIFVPKLTPQLGNRLVAAVRAGRELLGSVWVEVTDPVDAARMAALVDGARTAALHLLRSRASTDLERQAEADLVIRLLEHPESADVARLGLPSADLRVIAVQAHAGEGEHGAAVLAFQRATAGFGWSRPGRSACSATSSTRSSRPPTTPSAGCARWCASCRRRPRCWPASAARRRRRSCRPPGRRQTSAWRCRPASRSCTTTRGHGCCCTGWPLWPKPAGCRPADRYPIYCDTTPSTGRSTRRR
ncbi:hypothetical protein [Lentzea guizhouensis]|uniref:hypothetical protein n=1 Tax=Lentzea guizhouensis TaxID=1586287 RepID=UPI0030030587